MKKIFIKEFNIMLLKSKFKKVFVVCWRKPYV